jgi:hypothetical protein
LNLELGFWINQAYFTRWLGFFEMPEFALVFIVEIERVKVRQQGDASPSSARRINVSKLPLSI